MDFHITQPGSSVATSLIDGESKPKHVLLLEIKVLVIQIRCGFLFIFLLEVNLFYLLLCLLELTTKMWNMQLQSSTGRWLGMFQLTFEEVPRY